MGAFLKKRWFLVSLVILIAVGLWLGTYSDEESALALAGKVNPRLTTAWVLFLMAFSLDSRHLRESFRYPGPVLWACTINYAFIPLAAWPLMQLQLVNDFRVGLMIAATVPCTLAAASVWTRKAGGNDAVSLMVTLATNTACFVVTPFWLNLTMAQQVTLDSSYMVWRLLQAVLIPTILGQMLRLVPKMARFASHYKTPIGVVAQVSILLLVFSAACKAGTELNGSNADSPNAQAVFLVWGSCIFLHFAAMTVGITGAKTLGFNAADRAAVAFASSQKTLPIGVLVATDPGMFGNSGVPFAVFPMLMYHASQLFIDTLVADRLSLQARLSQTGEEDGDLEEQASST